MWKLTTALLLTILLSMFIGLPTGMTAELAPLLSELQQAAAGTRTLSSPFVQEKHLAIFSETLVSQGRFAYQQPDQLRWELLTPVASGFVLQGQKGVRWNALSGETEKFSVDTDPVMAVVAQQLLAWARVDLDWLQQRYRMELQNSTPVTLKLSPLDPGEASFIDHLTIVFSKDRSHVVEVLMVDQDGDSTRIRFTDVRINAALPPDIFSAPEF